MADTLALRSQLDDLKNEYLECKRVDTNKYTLIEVRKSFKPSFTYTNLTTSGTFRTN